MKPYMPQGRLTEDPLDGPYPSRRSRWLGVKRRRTLRRKMRGHKKGARQEGRVLCVPLLDNASSVMLGEPMRLGR